MNERIVRARAFLDRHTGTIVAVLVVCALLGGYLTYGTHIDPGVETETIEESSWSSSGQYSHQARVTMNTPVFDRGDVLRDRPSYFNSVTPILNGTLRYAYEATEGGELRVEAEHALVLRSVSDADGEESVEYWRIEEPLGSATAESVGPADTVRAPFRLNVTATGLRLDAIEEDLGGTPGQTEILVQSDVTITGTRNGANVDRTRTYEMRIDPEGNVYSVEGDEAQTDSGSQTRDVSVEATYGPVRGIGAPLLVLVSLIGCLGLAVGRWQGIVDVTETEREWLEYAASSREYEEWISRGRIPDEALAGPRISVETLDGLVDVAIDSNRRVLEDRDRGVCVALVDGLAYTYNVPPAVRSHKDGSSPEVASDTDDERDASAVASEASEEDGSDEEDDPDDGAE